MECSLVAGISAVTSIPTPALLQALLLLSSELQRLGVCLEDDRRQQRAGFTLRRFIATYLAMLQSESTALFSDISQLLRDLAFLQRLQNLWGHDDSVLSQTIDEYIVRREEVSGVFSGHDSLLI